MLCLIHCLALPVALVLFPTFTSIDLSTVDTFWEYVFIGLSIVSVYTIVQMHRTHKRFTSALPIAFLGIVLLLIALFGHSHNFGIILPAGSVLILVAHVLNLKMCNAHRNCLKGCAHTKAAETTP